MKHGRMSIRPSKVTITVRRESIYIVDFLHTPLPGCHCKAIHLPIDLVDFSLARDFV